ncbi:hypothetical protein FKM82_028341 [Ascaphus truei]
MDKIKGFVPLLQFVTGRGLSTKPPLTATNIVLSPLEDKNRNANILCNTFYFILPFINKKGIKLVPVLRNITVNRQYIQSV